MLKLLIVDKDLSLYKKENYLFDYLPYWTEKGVEIDIFTRENLLSSNLNEKVKVINQPSNDASFIVFQKMYCLQNKGKYDATLVISNDKYISVKYSFVGSRILYVTNNIEVNRLSKNNPYKIIIDEDKIVLDNKNLNRNIYVINKIFVEHSKNSNSKSPDSILYITDNSDEDLEKALMVFSFLNRRYEKLRFVIAADASLGKIMTKINLNNFIEPRRLLSLIPTTNINKHILSSFIWLSSRTDVEIIQLIRFSIINSKIFIVDHNNYTKDYGNTLKGKLFIKDLNVANITNTLKIFLSNKKITLDTIKYIESASREIAANKQAEKSLKFMGFI